MVFLSPENTRIAYLSMEVGLEAAMPTYSGGLGVLAGDSLRAAADLGLKVAAVTLLHRNGYFRQRLDQEGTQTEEPYGWAPEQHLEELPVRPSVQIEGRSVGMRVWRYVLRGVAGHVVPVYFLDTATPDNSDYDRTLTDVLYGGDLRYRLCQETLLGIGGIAALRALGHRNVETYHMNEGHSGLLTLALLREHLGNRGFAEATIEDFEGVRRKCVFTVHTPVAAGHDRFSLKLVEQVLGADYAALIGRLPVVEGGDFNLTHLALFFSRAANGVSMKHGEVSRRMFPEYAVGAITNGVHAATWASPPIAGLLDDHLPDWRRDNTNLRYAMSLPLERLHQAHREAKKQLAVEVESRTGVRLDTAAFTIGFARRATGYKRADLLFADPSRLRRIVRRVGPLQVVYGGKAHPRDERGKALIRRIFQASRALARSVRAVYLEEYDLEIARYLVSGVDVWLNNPEKPLEASGTSGMKAAVNGVPSLSVLDGWWIEGCQEGVTGWAIGDAGDAASDAQAEAVSLYDKLEHIVMPTFYQRPQAYTAVMRNAIALNGSYFNSQRQMHQYLLNLYRDGDGSRTRPVPAE